VNAAPRTAALRTHGADLPRGRARAPTPPRHRHRPRTEPPAPPTPPAPPNARAREVKRSTKIGLAAIAVVTLLESGASPHVLLRHPPLRSTDNAQSTATRSTSTHRPPHPHELDATEGTTCTPTRSWAGSRGVVPARSPAQPSSRGQRHRGDQQLGHGGGRHRGTSSHRVQLNDNLTSPPGVAEPTSGRAAGPTWTSRWTRRPAHR